MKADSLIPKMREAASTMRAVAARLSAQAKPQDEAAALISAMSRDIDRLANEWERGEMIKEMAQTLQGFQKQVYTAEEAKNIFHERARILVEDKGWRWQHAPEES